ncbi:hypothetical protein [Cellulosimicrobium sp. CUA-896]|uniref:hypothetical protein n=1 Tax=Cellulosimicrobium sp. CUA-896 TaxID=1517881 RepID=UPI001115445F|nr:hypothetical protein [Cellulosimicrobium sp. CUA-896]
MTTQLVTSSPAGGTGGPTAADGPAGTGPDASGGHRAGSRTTLWRRFLARRLVGVVVNIALLVVLTFFIVQLIPGTPRPRSPGRTRASPRWRRSAGPSASTSP